MLRKAQYLSERRKGTIAAIAACLIAGLGVEARAQDTGAPPPAQPSTLDLAKKAQNPVADLISVPLQSNFNGGYGAKNAPQSSSTQYVLNIQPVIPLTLGDSGFNLITRPILPVIRQPDLTGTPEDYAAVHALQDQVRLVPLGSYGKDYRPAAGKVDPAIDMKTAVREQVNALDAVSYFKLLAELMKTNPPSAADAPEVARFAAIGLVPGRDFDAGKLDADFLDRLPEVASDRIMLQFKLNPAVKNLNGWNYTTKTGLYGTDYLMRALITAIGLGANRPQDAVYPTSLKDAGDAEYDGAHRYVMRFEKGMMPPAQGFWSLTMYDSDYFFVSNPLNRYSISARQDLKVGPDGSVELYIQNESPGAGKESNWLPAPKGKFVLMMRMYWPNENDPSIINGTWTPAAVKKVA